MTDLFTTSGCLIHEVNVTVDPDRCVKCGAVNRWVVPVSIDYEAAAIAMLGLLQNKNVSSRQLVYGTVDAALGGQDETL